MKAFFASLRFRAGEKLQGIDELICLNTTDRLILAGNFVRNLMHLAVQSHVELQTSALDFYCLASVNVDSAVNIWGLLARFDFSENRKRCR